MVNVAVRGTYSRAVTAVVGGMMAAAQMQQGGPGAPAGPQGNPGGGTAQEGGLADNQAIAQQLQQQGVVQ